MTKQAKDKAINEWKKRVYDNVVHVDPHEERVWEDLAVGFFMGLGFDYGDAITLYYEATARRVV